MTTKTGEKSPVTFFTPEISRKGKAERRPRLHNIPLWYMAYILHNLSPLANTMSERPLHVDIDYI